MIAHRCMHYCCKAIFKTTGDYHTGDYSQPEIELLLQLRTACKSNIRSVKTNLKLYQGFNGYGMRKFQQNVYCELL